MAIRCCLLFFFLFFLWCSSIKDASFHIKAELHLLTFIFLDFALCSALTLQSTITVLYTVRRLESISFLYFWGWWRDSCYHLIPADLNLAGVK